MDELKEFTDSPEETVKDLRVELTLNEGDNSFTLEKINGELKGLIAAHNSPDTNGILLKVSSEMGYDIFTDPGFKNGPFYMPITISSLSPNAHKRGYQSNSFFLNERLIITARGTPNTKLSLVIRYC